MIKALDTSVIARIIAQDDARQLALAMAALQHPCFISHTVVLESAWLLTSRYKMPKALAAAALLDILHTPQVTTESLDLVEWALGRFANGASVGDMMHIIGASRCTAIQTFDRDMGKDAGPDSPIPIEILA